MLFIHIIVSNRFIVACRYMMLYTKYMNTSRLKQLIATLTKLSGINIRHAQKIAFALLYNKPILQELIISSQNAHDSVFICKNCRVFTENKESMLCNICADTSRNIKQLCIVSNITSLINLERTGEYHGYYFLLELLVTHTMKILPEDVQLNKLNTIIEENGVEELIIALSPTIEGQATTMHIKNNIKKQIRIRGIGIGIPMGGDINMTDTQTLKMALTHLIDM